MLTVIKQPVDGLDYDIIVQYNGVPLGSFKMSRVINSSLSGGPSFPEYVQAVLLKNNVKTYSLEQIDRYLQGK